MTIPISDSDWPEHAQYLLAQIQALPQESDISNIESDINGVNSAVSEVINALVPMALALNSLLPLPVVTGLVIGPSGGLSVGSFNITGSGFTTASAVYFGATSVGAINSTWSVSSDSLIAGAIPSGTSGSTVDVTVVNPKGTSETSSADLYTYP